MDILEKLIDIAVLEDIGGGDITTENLISPDLEGRGVFVARQDMVLAGIDVAKRVFARFDPNAVVTPIFKDGDKIRRGSTILEVNGKMQALLKGERIALNFLQRLSGIATNVRVYVEELESTGCRLVDTRKTTPGWRHLEKYAVRVGGAYNHRAGLFDGVLIKDNHIAACGGIKKAVSDIKDKISHLAKIEVETSNISEVKEALEAGADVMMLDNMDLVRIKEAVNVIDGRALVEASGNVTRTDLKRLADAGVDIISSGALTHQARSVDISMRINKIA